MAMADDLGNLILSLNPYTYRHILDTGLDVGRIDIYCRRLPPILCQTHHQHRRHE